MIVLLFATDWFTAKLLASSSSDVELLENLLEEKIESLAKLYSIDLSQVAWVKLWIHPSRDVVIPTIEIAIVDAMYFILLPAGGDCDRLSPPEVLLADAELLDYIAFYIVMACGKPQQQLLDGDAKLITYYTLKYGYKG